MQITVTHGDGEKVFLLTVEADLEVDGLKALCEAETDVPVADMILLHNGRALDEGKRIGEAGLADGDMVLLQKRMVRAAPAPAQQLLPDFSQIVVPRAGASSAAAGPSTSRGGGGGGRPDDPATIREMLKNDPEALAMLRQNNARLAEAYDSGNMEEFAKVLKEQYEARAERERQRIRMLTADPFDMEAQKLIAQEIENKNIDQNMELAMEYNPESFGTVIMLYINCRVNGHPIKAFVDSGAQATIMSQAAAERCGIMRLVDRRWAGIAKGVGTQKIIGRVHLAQVQIEKSHLPCSFSILEEQPMDMLLGLDMLKRHQCVLDLRNGKLLIGTCGTETPFLSEAELPECARLSGTAAALNQSAKEMEEKQLKEAMEKSAAETKKRKEDPSASSSSSALAIQPGDNFTEQNVQDLMKYSFTRENVIQELRSANGDVKTATAALFAKSLKF